MIMKDEGYTVGDLAEYFGVSKDTIRWYDRVGILSPSKNRDNNYRQYTREQLMAMNYIMRLRQMNLSLGEISELVNDSNVEHSLTVIQLQNKALKEEIERLKIYSRMAEDYQKIFANIIQYNGKSMVRESPKMLCRPIEDSVISALKDFEQLSASLVPMYTFIQNGEHALDILSDDDLKNYSKRNQYTRLALTMIDEDDLSETSDFPTDKFEVIMPRRCLFSMGKAVTGVDYSGFVKLKESIRDSGYKIDGEVIYRMVSVNYLSTMSEAYYECWVPIK